MPLYEYDCKGCGGRFETLVRDGEEKPRCPTCGGTRLTKVFSVFSPATKGAGRSDPPVCGQGACPSCSPD